MIISYEAWAENWITLGAAHTSPDIYRALLLHHQEQHRHYHTLQHLQECLLTFVSVRASAHRPAEVTAALWFHDAIHDTTRHDNEERSAAWASDCLAGAHVAPEVVARVHALIMATCHRAAPTDADAVLLVDIDLAILGAAADRYAEYETQVREEYRHVPADVFALARVAILRGFLQRERIFQTPALHERLEHQARKNLEHSLSELKAVL